MVEKHGGGAQEDQGPNSAPPGGLARERAPAPWSPGYSAVFKQNGEEELSSSLCKQSPHSNKGVGYLRNIGEEPSV